MPIGYRAVRDLFHGRLQESQQSSNSTSNHARGRIAALGDYFDLLGLESDDYGNPLVALDDNNLPTLKEGRAKPSDFSLRHLGEAIFGHELFEELYNPERGFDFGMAKHLQEAAIGPEVFVDINTFNLSIAGLVNAEIMARFTAPKFIGRSLVTTKTTKMNGQKLIGIVPIRPQSAAAKGRQPGESHAEVGLGSAYQTTPETVEQALKCKVTREAAFFDLTGDVLAAAGEVGEELRYGEEKEIADGIMGVSASYNRNGTAYNTYQTSTPYINDHANPFSDETDVDDARQLFVGMTDPETGREIQVEGRTILCMPARELKFREQLFGSGVQVNTQFGNELFPARQRQTQSALATVGAGGAYTVIPLTSIWYNRALAADGLNLAASAAKEYWWLGDPTRAFHWMENWPIQPWQANADELTMKDHGLIAVYGANKRGRFFVREPRAIIRNKDA